MFKGKGWFGGSSLRKPKNPHSLEHLKYLHSVLSKNQIVTDANRSLLVEILRSIAEILIWGDQNDSTVFDFFLERNMLSFFLKIMDQRCGSYVCVQLLQTLNILFENIRNETSLYYLLSNNHVNSIIVHKFDFSDEEVMAYYISFLKTLSLKLNKHTIHFFHNEHTNDFPLYTEAIKFFNHSESMVRIAVRTLTLNVYKVDDKSMLKFIRDKTAAPYFSNLVWFIGNHVLELDACVRQDAGHQSQGRLSDLVAEHLDHMHYLNDILCLSIKTLNEVLVDHLVHRLLVPLYVFSLTTRRRLEHLVQSSTSSFDSEESDILGLPNRPRVDSVVSLFLLSQVFLIIAHVPLARALAKIIFHGNMEIFWTDSRLWRSPPVEQTTASRCSPLVFSPPAESLEDSLREGGAKSPSSSPVPDGAVEQLSAEDEFVTVAQSAEARCDVEHVMQGMNITDEEKEQQMASLEVDSGTASGVSGFTLSSRPFLEAILNALEVTEDDYSALFSLCLIHSMLANEGLAEAEFFAASDGGSQPSPKRNSPFSTAELTADAKFWFSIHLIDRLVKLLCASSFPNSKLRLATIELSVQLLVKVAADRHLVVDKCKTLVQDSQLAALEGAKEEATLQLRNFYKSEEIFLDMFEDEYNELKSRPLNVEQLMMDAKLLLPPTPTPMTGIEFSKRLPCGEVERTRRAIRVFFLLRDLTLNLCGEPETELPLTNLQQCYHVNDVLDLNNSDIIGCVMVTKDRPAKIRRYLAIESLQLIVVEPHPRKLGWGVANFVGFLQDMEVTGDRDDSRSLHVVFSRSGETGAKPAKGPVMTAKFLFEDHIRCMAAKQKLTKGRQLARQRKLQQIAKVLELPGEVTSRKSSSSSSFSLSMSSVHRFDPRARRGLHRCNAVDVTHTPGRSSSVRHMETSSPQRMFRLGMQRVPGSAAPATAVVSNMRQHSPNRNKFNTIRAEDVSPVEEALSVECGISGQRVKATSALTDLRVGLVNGSERGSDLTASQSGDSDFVTGGFQGLCLTSVSDADSDKDEPRMIPLSQVRARFRRPDSPVVDAVVDVDERVPSGFAKSSLKYGYKESRTGSFPYEEHQQQPMMARLNRGRSRHSSGCEDAEFSDTNRNSPSESPRSANVIRGKAKMRVETV